jgi:hypothetical protein
VLIVCSTRHATGYVATVKDKVTENRIARREKDTRLLKIATEQEAMQAQLQEKAETDKVIQGFIELSRSERLAASQLWQQLDAKKSRADLGQTWAARQQVKISRAMDDFVSVDREQRRQLAAERAVVEAPVRASRAEQLAAKAKEKSNRHWEWCFEISEMIIDVVMEVWCSTCLVWRARVCMTVRVLLSP